MDYTGPDVENEEVQEIMRRKRRSMLFEWPRSLLSLVRRLSHDERKSDKEASCDVSEKEEPSASIHMASLEPLPGIHGKHVSFHNNARTSAENLSSQRLSLAEVGIPSRGNSIDRTMTGMNTPWSASETAYEPPQQEPVPLNQLMNIPISISRSISPCSQSNSLRPRLKLKSKIIPFLKSFLNMPSIAILLAFPIALISPLKALFVVVPGTYIHPAPDGQPPLAFLLNTTTFIGAASVPIGLICLGSALARLKVPRGEWKTLPLGAIAWLAIAKMLLLPVLGVLICESLFVRVGLIPRDDKVLRFVCMYVYLFPSVCTCLP